MGIRANIRATTFNPRGDINPFAFFGLIKIRRRDKDNIHKLPARKTLLNEMVKNVGGTFGVVSSARQPITQTKVIGVSKIPNIMETHLGRVESPLI